MKEKLREGTARLSELAGNTGGQCAFCGAKEGVLARWLEHNEWDNPEAKVVILCERCGKKLIEPHPRLYRQLGDREFVPGSSQVCVGCKHQRRMSCWSPVAKFHGGPGLQFKPEPNMAHINAGRNSRWVAYEAEPVTECSGRMPGGPL